MSHRRNQLAVVLALAILVGGSIGLYFMYNMEGDTFYSGSEVFQTEQDYINFKLEVAHPDVELEEVEVLASEPPIIVKFKVSVVDDYQFPYGAESLIKWFDQEHIGGHMLFGFVIFLVMLVALVTWLFTVVEEEKK